MVDQLRYIAVEGPIGVGKTTLTQMLAKDLNARLILEEVSENPFLANFYQNPNQYAFQAQIFFLLSRYKQQSALKQQDLFNQVTVCDYIFAKDLIFASMNLSQEELDLYDKVFQLLDSQLPKPDIVVFLQASSEILSQRIKKRKIDYEKNMDPEYLEQLAQSYSHYFFKYTDTPLLVVNTSGINLVKNPGDYEIIKKEIFNVLKSGRQKHYINIDNT